MRTRALAVALCLAAGLIAPLARADAVNIVEVRSNEFLPRLIEIARGETVTWVARDAGHTVSADDGRFSFPVDGGSLSQGQSASWTFSDDETFAYRCAVHGPGMAGVVVVGAGSPPPPPPPEPPRRIVPSEAFPTIAAALAGAEPSTIVELRAGTYHYGVTVSVPHVTIRGTGASPGEVVIDGDGARATGIRVLADGVRIENLTAREHGVAGIVIEDAAGFAVEHVRVEANGSDGIRIAGARRGSVRGVTAEGSARAGIAIEGCETCDVVVDGVLARDNGVGVLVQDAGSTVVRDSVLMGNGTGIVLRTQRGAHLVGNHIVDNGDAGVWIDGGWFDVVESNTVIGHGFGIVVTALAGPSYADRIVWNVVEGSVRGDVAWDGIGADVCFGTNARGDGSEPTSEPALAQSIYSCDLPHTVGIPWPAVSAAMA
jgi:plastocyanin